MGKTTALKHLVLKTGVFGISTDAIRSTIRGVLGKEDHEDLFKITRGKFGSDKNVYNMANNPLEVIAHQNKESEAVWRSVVDYLDYNIEDGQDTAIEGVAILPRLLAGYKKPFRAVFIVNTENQTEKIMEHAHSNEYDWLRKYDDKTIRAFCIFNRELNAYYLREAKKYNLPYVIPDYANFEGSISLVLDTLRG